MVRLLAAIFSTLSLGGNEVRSMTSTTAIRLYVWKNTWRSPRESDQRDRVEVREVELTIEGDEKNGYHLIATPQGCFGADTLHDSLEDAMRAAREAFGVATDAWQVHG